LIFCCVFAYPEVFDFLLWVRVTFESILKGFYVLLSLRIFCYKGWILRRLSNVLQYNEVLGKGSSKIVYPGTWCLWFLTWLWWISIVWKYVSYRFSIEWINEYYHNFPLYQISRWDLKSYRLLCIC
jgi:hypothetical protein